MILDGAPVKQVAAAAGISASTLRRWVKAAASGAAGGQTSPARSRARLLLLDQENIAPKIQRILLNEGFQFEVVPLARHALASDLVGASPWQAMIQVFELSLPGAARLIDLIQRSGRDVPLVSLCADLRGRLLGQASVDYECLTDQEQTSLGRVVERLHRRLVQRAQLRDCRRHFDQLQRCCFRSFDAAPAPIAILGVNRHIYANPAYMRLFGYSCFGALQDAGAAALLDGPARSAIDQALAHSEDDFSTAVSLSLTDPGGTVFSMRAELTPFPGISRGVQVVLHTADMDEAPTPCDEVCNSTPREHSDEERALWTERVVRALKDDNLFSIVYQPIVHLAGEAPASYEALLRLHNEGGGEHLPGSFLPAAQAAGLMGVVDHWVIRRALMAANAEAAGGRRIRLFVNTSRESLLSEDFCPWLARLINDHQVDPAALVFEVSEADMLLYGSRSQPVLDGLRRLGCAITLDHFLGREASFALLHSMKFDYVKLDASLVLGLHQDPAAQARIAELVASLVALGQQTIASCVQDAEIVAILWKCGVHYVQGYFLQQPSKALDYDFFRADHEVEVSPS